MNRQRVHALVFTLGLVFEPGCSAILGIEDVPPGPPKPPDSGAEGGREGGSSDGGLPEAASE
jgi:hypothetical protein